MSCRSAGSLEGVAPDTVAYVPPTKDGPGGWSVYGSVYECYGCYFLAVLFHLVLVC